METFFVRTKNIILDFLFPKKCVGCGREGIWLCDRCFSKIILVKSPSCPFCNQLTLNGKLCSRCRAKSSLTGVLVAAYYHDGPLKEAIHKFKYNRVRDLAEDLANILIMRLERGFPTGKLILVPIPLHRAREAERGFNQARELAKIISASYDIEIKESLVRKKYTQPQVKKSGRERRESLSKAFSVKNKESIQDKTVILIDDVFTTGTTLSECAKILRLSGARQVWGLVLAKV